MFQLTCSQNSDCVIQIHENYLRILHNFLTALHKNKLLDILKMYVLNGSLQSTASYNLLFLFQ